MRPFACACPSSRRLGLLWGVSLLGIVVFAAPGVAADAEQAGGDRTTIASDVSGRDIFNREWLVNDPRSHGGDGLGPVFNDSSCVACHNQGGPGGAGPASKNVEIVTAVSPSAGIAVRRQPSATEQFVRSMLGLGQESTGRMDPETIKRMQQMEQEQLAKLHPGFRSARSVVLHRFGTEAEYAPWRQRLAGAQTFGGNAVVARVPMETVEVNSLVQVMEAPQPVKTERTSEFQKLQQAIQEIQRTRGELGGAVFTRTAFVDGNRLTLTRRNAIALFGAGLIDAVPDEAIEAAANQKHEAFPEVSGRVSRLKDGRIGRFGWKAQKATLYDFTMTACAVEVGLNVPDHAQSGTPLNPRYTTTNYDLNQQECDALVDYLRNLPAPQQRQTEDAREATYLHAGSQLFASVGCAACHAPELGEVPVYSDLLVHDMGADLVDTGDYGSFSPVPDSAEEVVEELADSEGGATEGQQAQLRIVGATRQEWRTAPLWGCRDSGPYLHDGRAQTLEQAIAFHGGEAAGSAQKFFMLSPSERAQVTAFLKSLTAPSAQQLASLQ